MNYLGLFVFKSIIVASLFRFDFTLFYQKRFCSWFFFAILDTLATTVDNTKKAAESAYNTTKGECLLLLDFILLLLSFFF